MKSSVIAILFNQSKDKFLAIKRRDVPVWVLPGGGIDENETPEEAALREIFEETALKVTIKRKVAEYTPVNCLTRPTHFYECEYREGSPTIGDETTDIGFFSLKNFPEPFFFLHRDWLNDALENNPNIMRKAITQITFLKLFKYICRHPSWVIRLALSRIGFPLNSK